MTIAFTARSLVQHFEDIGDYKKAEHLLLDILSQKQREGAKSISLAEDLYELGLVYLASNNFAQADHFLQRAYEIQVKELGYDHIDTKETHNVLRELQEERLIQLKSQAS
jgi:tetratricopeptide (TPR) repeat protein